MVAMAACRGLDTRVGLEDGDRLPDGTIAADNADLVAAARRTAGEAGTTSARARP
jgi:uncharacterized protein (DUF849 family)